MTTDNHEETSTDGSQLDRRAFIKSTGVAAGVAAGLEGILASGRAPAFAQGMALTFAVAALCMLSAVWSLRTSDAFLACYTILVLSYSLSTYIAAPIGFAGLARPICDAGPTANARRVAAVCRHLGI